jgi:hypothetical protein
MIVVHRLLKNEIPAREYFLATSGYLGAFDRELPCDLTWTASRQQYDDVGEIAVHYALLEQIKKQIPDPPARPSTVIPVGDDALELEIAAPLLNVYMKVIDVEGKRDWVVGLDDLERKKTTARIDERHTCIFQGMRVDFKLLHGEISAERAVYLEHADFEGTPFEHQQMYTLERIDPTTTRMRFEVKWSDASPPPDEMKQTFLGGCQASFEIFKQQIETG